MKDHLDTKAWSDLELGIVAVEEGRSPLKPFSVTIEAEEDKDEKDAERRRRLF